MKYEVHGFVKLKVFVHFRVGHRKRRNCEIRGKQGFYRCSRQKQSKGCVSLYDTYYRESICITLIFYRQYFADSVQTAGDQFIDDQSTDCRGSLKQKAAERKRRDMLTLPALISQTDKVNGFRIHGTNNWLLI